MPRYINVDPHSTVPILRAVSVPVRSTRLEREKHPIPRRLVYMIFTYSEHLSANEVNHEVRAVSVLAVIVAKMLGPWM
jgi:hypothetical protein